MSIATDLTRISEAKSALATAISGKGVTVPAATLIDGYAALVDAIQTGGGGFTPPTAQFTLAEEMTVMSAVNAAAFSVK